MWETNIKHADANMKQALWMTHCRLNKSVFDIKYLLRHIGRAINELTEAKDKIIESQTLELFDMEDKSQLNLFEDE
jgi:hypothetical protein